MEAMELFGGAALYVVSRGDNVATALADLEPGPARLIGDASGECIVLQRIPFGHKAALRAIAQGEAVIKYGVRIAVASAPVAPGGYVHIHNAKSLCDERSNTFSDAPVPQDREYNLIR